MTYSVYLSGHTDDADAETLVAAAQEALDLLPGGVSGSVSGTCADAPGFFSRTLTATPPEAPSQADDGDIPDDAPTDADTEV